MLKLLTINDLLWMAITRLKSVKYLRCAYVDTDIQNVLLLWHTHTFLQLMVNRPAPTLEVGMFLKVVLSRLLTDGRYGDYRQ